MRQVTKTRRSSTTGGGPRYSIYPLMPLALLALLLSLASCGRGAPEGGAPAYGGTLVIAAPSDLDFANSLISMEVYTQELLQGALFLTLIRQNDALEYEPRLARSWELLGDTAVVFHLRDDVRWHDGVRTTAYDVAFTYERAREPETGYANVGELRHWRELQVVDSFTVRLDLVPHPEPLSIWSNLAIMPRHLLDSIPPSEMRQAGFNHEPVGNGPFRFDSKRANDRWILTANPDFPEELGGRPYLDRLVWRVIPESTARETELLIGQADLVIGVPARDLARLEETPGVRTLVRPSRKYQAIIWNGRREGLDDPRVRHALAMAIDRSSILQALRGGYGELATGPVYPAHWAFDSTLVPIAHDPAAARALLAEAGFQDRPLEIELLIPTGNEYNRNVATMVQAQLAEVGVRLQPRALEFTTMASVITAPERDFDAVFLSWESGPRLELNDLFHSSALNGPFQFASYRNSDVDRLLDQASQADRETARPLWHRLQSILRDEQPWTIFYYTPDLFAHREELQGVRMDIRGALLGVADWWKEGAVRPE